MVILAIYVDDKVLTETDLEEIYTLKRFLHNQFKIKELGLLNNFLGIEVLYTSFGCYFIKDSFIHDLLKEFNCDTCTLVVCSLELHEKLKANVGIPCPSLRHIGV